MAWSDPMAGYTTAMNYQPIQMPLDTGVGALGSLDTVNSAPPSMWDSFNGWLNNSGILGKKLADGTRVDGWGGLALGGAQGLLGGYLGMQQLGVARDTLAQNKRQFDLNFGNQVQTINTHMEDRQRARVASDPGAYQSVGDYMKTNGLKGIGG